MYQFSLKKAALLRINKISPTFFEQNPDVAKKIITGIPNEIQISKKDTDILF